MSIASTGREIKEPAVAYGRVKSRLERVVAFVKVKPSHQPVM
jgi:hypothetical protein